MGSQLISLCANLSCFLTSTAGVVRIMVFWALTHTAHSCRWIPTCRSNVILSSSRPKDMQLYMATHTLTYSKCTSSAFSPYSLRPRSGEALCLFLVSAYNTPRRPECDPCIDCWLCKNGSRIYNLFHVR
jgi:hypothetical protein